MATSPSLTLDDFSLHQQVLTANYLPIVSAETRIHLKRAARAAMEDHPVWVQRRVPDLG